MLQIAIIGLGTFAKRMIDELSEVGSELIIVDKDPNIIEKYKAKAKEAYILNVLNVESLSKIIPVTIDAAILDFDDKLEPSILCTHYLHQMGIKNIIVETQDDTHGELLQLAGAHQIVYPELEAAKKITPLLLSKKLCNFIQLSDDFSIAEVEIMDEMEGKSLIDSKIRSTYGLNVIASREKGAQNLAPIPGPDFVFSKDCTILVAGSNNNIEKYVNKEMKKAPISSRIMIDRFFKHKK